MKRPTIPSAYISDASICTRYEISIMTLWRYRRAGKLPQPRKINGRNKTSIEDLEAAEEMLFDSPDAA